MRANPTSRRRILGKGITRWFTLNPSTAVNLQESQHRGAYDLEEEIGITRKFLERLIKLLYISKLHKYLNVSDKSYLNMIFV
jgi:hypothetical protein